MKRFHLSIFTEFKLLMVAAVLLFANSAFAQEQNIIKLCDKYLQAPYISDGQQYKALLADDELAEFRATFYGGSVYRIVSCSSLKEGNIVFAVYDKERNLLFSSKDYQNAPYWDFKFKTTTDCIIEAEINSKTEKSGYAILLIGFKQ
ncbi:MAG TPA: hypothetical protein DCQ31_10215 [Bacteroidales bacterium]|nr:hypothetical protein [Bacteroidales bacterium]